MNNAHREHGSSTQGDRLGTDHPCMQCSYNLRSLPASAACPECGYPVEDSLRKRQVPLDRRERLAATAYVMAACFVVMAGRLLAVASYHHSSMGMSPNSSMFWRLNWGCVVLTLAVTVAGVALMALSAGLRRRWWFWFTVACSFLALFTIPPVGVS